MTFSALARRFTVPVRQFHARAWVAFALSGELCVGCFGGQTGTEATPSEPERNGSGGTSTTDSADGGSGAGTAVLTPGVDSSGCDPAQVADGSIDAQTGIDSNEVSTFLQAPNPIDVTYGDGTTSFANLQIVATQSCSVSTASGPNSLRVLVTTRITSDDGRLQLLLSGNADALAAAGGGVGGVQLNATLRCERTADPTTVTPCAVGGVDLSPFTSIVISLELSAQSIAATTHVLGTLRISGVDAESCDTTPCSAAAWGVIAEIALTGDI